MRHLSITIALGGSLLAGCAFDSGSEPQSGPSLDGGDTISLGGSTRFAAAPIEVPAAPRLVSPASLATATSGQPLLSWEPAHGATGSRVEICAERSCISVIQAFDSTTDHERPPVELAPGLHFWRVRALDGDRVGATSATWSLAVAPRGSARRDTAWGTRADFDGDGRTDFAIGAPGAFRDAGRVRVYLGGSSVSSLEPSVLAMSDRGEQELGGSLAVAGDVNGDGFGDLVVGANAALGERGRAHVYLGGANGLSPEPALSLTGEERSYGNLGYSVAGVGDVNGDGYGDVMIGMADSPRAFLHLGSAAGLSPDAAVSLSGPDGSGFGRAIAPAGDVDGDGLADVAVGAQPIGGGRGSVYVYFGDRAATLARSIVLGPPDSVVDASTGFGQSVACAGDVDGDGYADLIVGAPYVALDTGAAFLFRGGPDGPEAAPSLVLSGEIAGRGARFGHSVSTAGDLDGDGFSDIAIGAHWPSPEAPFGSVHVYHGSTAGLSPAPRTSLVGSDRFGEFGWTAVGAGDLDGDGLDDLLVTTAAQGDYSGRVSLYPGTPTGVSAEPTASWEGPDGPGGLFGEAIAGSR